MKVYVDWLGEEVEIDPYLPSMRLPETTFPIGFGIDENGRPSLFVRNGILYKVSASPLEFAFGATLNSNYKIQNLCRYRSFNYEEDDEGEEYAVMAMDYIEKSVTLETFLADDKVSGKYKTNAMMQILLTYWELRQEFNVHLRDSHTENFIVEHLPKKRKFFYKYRGREIILESKYRVYFIDFEDCSMEVPKQGKITPLVHRWEQDEYEGEDLRSLFGPLMIRGTDVYSNCPESLKEFVYLATNKQRFDTIREFNNQNLRKVAEKILPFDEVIELAVSSLLGR